MLSGTVLWRLYRFNILTTASSNAQHWHKRNWRAKGNYADQVAIDSV